MTTRRGFFKSLMGAAAVPVGLTVPMRMPVVTEERASFNFTCGCGNGMIADVPKEIGETVTLDCSCGNRWELEWAGDRFKTKLMKVQNLE